LIIQTASLGDVVLSTSLVETVHSQFPECKIDFLLKKGFEGLFEGHPFINELLIWDKTHHKYHNLLKVIQIVRSNQYDAVINVQRHFSSGLVTVLSGSKKRSGFTKNPLSFGFTHKPIHLISHKGLKEHEIVRNHRLISPFTECVPLKPKLYPGKSDEDFIKSWKQGKFITVSPASLWFTKQYPIEKWIEFVDEVDEKIQIYLLGAPNDKFLCDKIIAQANKTNIVSLAGKLSLLQSAALMKGAVMNFVNDSAPLHLASATNAPVTAIFCSTVPAFGFGPLSDDSAIVESQSELSCRPCGLHGHTTCPEKHFLCALSINNSQLLKRINI
jgi:ADP-heptose:LPS heptosyltransferase